MPDQSSPTLCDPPALSPADIRRDTARIAAELAGMTGGTDPFAAAARATRMPMIITNPRLPDNPVIFVNDAFCRMSGYARPEILNRNCRFLQCEETDPGTIARIRAAIEAMQPIEIDVRNKRKDGKLFWNRLLVAPVMDARGALAYYFASQVDVTLERDRLDSLESRNAALLAEVADRLRAQELSEARLRFATDAGRLGIWELDLVSEVLTTSPVFRDIFGHPDTEAMTYDAVVEAIHPDDRDRMRHAVTRSMETGADYDIEYRIQRQDGAAGWVDVRGQVWRGPDGTPLRIGGIALDVTARREAEARLAFSEESLRLSNDAAGIGTWDVDLRTDVLTWPARTKAMFGISPDAACGMADFYAGLHPDDREHTAERYAAAIDPDRRGLYDVEYRTIGKEDGVVRWVSAKGRGLFDETGRCVRAIGTAIDITGRKLAEGRQLALLRLGDRLRDMDDPAAMAFAAAEALGTTLNASRAGYATYDAAADHVVVGRDWTMPGTTSIAGVHRLRDYGTFLDDLIRGETVVLGDSEADLRTAAGTRSLAGIQARAIVNVPLMEGGRIVALFFVHDRVVRVWTAAEIAFVRDIAERTWTAVERRRAEAELRALNVTLAEGIKASTAERDRLWDMTNDLMGKGNAKGFLTAVNPAWQRTLGWDEAALLANPFMNLIDPEDRTATKAAIGRVAAGETVSDFINRIARTDATQRTILWTAIPEPGTDTFYFVGRDITEQRRTEDALRQSQKMEAVGQLTGGLAHDFNNLLVGITGSLELLQTRVAQGRIKDIDRYINAAQDSARRAAALTHRLLAFSRRQTLEPKPTDVNRLVAGMENLVQRTMGPEIRIETVTGTNLWTTLVDQSQLENALLNLCINARDAMPQGGTLSIETANRWLGERAATERDIPPGQYVSLSVSDDGTGMTPEVMARAFDPFFTTKPLGQGTGLGLSMIYGFVRQSGGEVRICSEVGRGTTVNLYLPRHSGEAEEGEDATALTTTPRAKQGETVLVVDDEPTVRMLVTEVLEDLGYTAIEAADGASGLRVLQSQVRIDLLITDVGLPGGMNGRQLADAARMSRGALRVLFITGYAENAVMSDGHLDPGMQVLTKPFTLEALASRIQDLLGGR